MCMHKYKYRLVINSKVVKKEHISNFLNSPSGKIENTVCLFIYLCLGFFVVAVAEGRIQTEKCNYSHN